MLEQALVLETLAEAAAPNFPPQPGRERRTGDAEAMAEPDAHAFRTSQTACDTPVTTHRHSHDAVQAI